MAFRHLLYLRSTLFLALLLTVLHSSTLAVWMGWPVSVLLLYVFVHGLLFWMWSKGEIPGTWSLNASIFDVLVIAFVIYSLEGRQADLYIAFFLAVIGSVLIESLAFSFVIAGIACAFYAVTVAQSPGGFSSQENLLRIVLLLVSAFSTAYLSHLSRNKDEAENRDEEERKLWNARMDTSRRIVGEIGLRLDQPLDKIEGIAEKLNDEGKGSEIKWEVDGVRGQLKRINKLLNLDVERFNEIDLQETIERAMYKFETRAKDAGVQIDWADMPDMLLRGSKDHLAEAIYSLLLEVLGSVPKGGRVNISSSSWSAEWWESDKGVDRWLGLSIAGSNGNKTSQTVDTESGLGVEGAQWMIAKHGGHLEKDEHGFKVVLPFPRES